MPPNDLFLLSLQKFKKYNRYYNVFSIHFGDLKTSCKDTRTGNKVII